jgi:hypothetical protein
MYMLPLQFVHIVQMCMLPLQFVHIVQLHNVGGQKPDVCVCVRVSVCVCLMCSCGGSLDTFKWVICTIAAVIYTNKHIIYTHYIYIYIYIYIHTCPIALS